MIEFELQTFSFLVGITEIQNSSFCLSMVVRICPHQYSSRINQWLGYSLHTQFRASHLCSLLYGISHPSFSSCCCFKHVFWFYILVRQDFFSPNLGTYDGRASGMITSKNCKNGNLSGAVLFLQVSTFPNICLLCVALKSFE